MRFREAREARGMSQKFVAISLGVKPPNVSRWEAGVTYPSIENLVALSKLYGVTVDYLLGLDNIPVAANTRGVTDYEEAILLQAYRQLNEAGKSAVTATAQALLHQADMRKELSFGSAM